MILVVTLALVALAPLSYGLPCSVSSSTSTSYVATSSIVSATAAVVAADGISIASSADATSTEVSTSIDAASGGPVGYASLNGGTTGGQNGQKTTVTTVDELTQAVRGDDAAVVYVSGTISGSASVRVGSNKSILGANPESGLNGIGLYIKGVTNVIVQNLKISKVLADNNDAISIQDSTNVWIDHVDVSSDRDHDKDYYDGLIDITHAADYVTVSNSYIHDHWKASLIGHSDKNGDEDTGFLHVTYANNHWSNINSRQPSLRFGTAHIFNSYYDSGDTGLNTRMGAQALIESSVFVHVESPIESQDSKVTGYAVVKDVDLGGGENTAPEGTLTSVPYKYSLLGSANVKAAVVAKAGNTLTLG